jgi:hypothetical protein
VVNDEYLKSSFPIIFIGMHRSGTSLVGELLEDLGLYVGKYKDANNESLFFQDINKWLFRQAAARWDNPETVNKLWEQRDEVMEWTKHYIVTLMKSPRAIQFLGLSKYLRQGGILNFDSPWGWKDPRNTFTLPMWLSIFPNAKVIFIQRHGVDVANSLVVRADKGIAYRVEQYRKYQKYIWLKPKRNGFIESTITSNLEGGFNLWQLYMDEAIKNINLIENHKVLTIKYEELLKNPESEIQRAAVFCGLKFDKGNLKKVCGSINSTRALNYKNHKDLSEFADQNVGVLKKYGY